MKSLLRSLGRRFLGRGKPKPAAFWDRQYRAGHWDGLASDEEYPRYALLASLTRRHAPATSGVLEVGCGTGVLAGHLSDSGLRYSGFDLSEAAIETARQANARTCSFFVGDGERGPPEEAVRRGPFSVIVFNEVLYYFSDPTATARDYERLLSPGGVFAVSIWNPDRWRVLLKNFDRQFEKRLAVLVGGEARKPWRISISIPRPGAGAVAPPTPA